MTDVALRDGQSSTYGGSVTGLVGVSGDILTFTAPTVVGKLFKLIRLNVTGYATAATDVNLTLVKRSTVDTGGTGAAVLTTPYDPQASAATTVVTSYTAAPTPGTLVGSAIRASKLTLAVTATGQAYGVVWQWGDRAAQAPRLIGPGLPLAVTVAQQWCLAVDSTVAGASYDIEFEFTEDIGAP